MKQLRPLLLLFLLLTSTVAAICQPILKCTEYKSGDVMNNSHVASYVQDSKGYLWFGTWIGLCRYDGREFRHFRPDGREVLLGSNRIMKVALDSHEDLWCLNFDNGLYRFDRNRNSYQQIRKNLQKYIQNYAYTAYQEKARRQMKLAPGFYLDAYFHFDEDTYWPQALQPDMSRAATRVKFFCNNLKEAVEVADTYVWLYSEHRSWW